MYDYFEDIVCINLDISIERRKHAEYYFDKLNIPARFYTATKHCKGGMYGCFESHIEVLKDAYKRNLNNLLVFEDDFLPTATYSNTKLQDAVKFMKNNDDWDIMHLGYSVIKDTSTIFDAEYVTEDIVKYNPYCAHALCYSKRAIKKIVETYEDYIGIVHYDMFISLYANLTNYCVVPMLFDQNFYFEYNNEAADTVEAILRFLFPFWAFTKLNYRVTILKYILNKYNNLTKYLYLLSLTIVIYKIKSSISYKYIKYDKIVSMLQNQ
jgi:GR25 family glycosyltransferase involved in LPS biosynthesis